EVEVELGEIEVRQTFKASRIGVIAGCYVTQGTVTRNARVRLYRGGKEIYDGPIDSLKRFNDEVKEVREGFECGIVLQRFRDIEQGDIMRPYVIEERERTLS
ncbi:MAG: translation initiation factor IF-2, partial [Planctomycetes bacterium]|nr:translation initiation factor IF-2 [Planctomycetota bacterium]